jgi:hypothetical protein
MTRLPARAHFRGEQRRKSEHDEFQAEVIRTAVLLGFEYYHTYDSRRSPAGWPDLVLCKFPRLLFVELKAGKDTIRTDQAKWLGLLQQFAGTWNSAQQFDKWMRIEVHVWRAPGDWYAITKALGVP